MRLPKVYVHELQGGKVYVGSTHRSVLERLDEHNGHEGEFPGAQWTTLHGPVVDTLFVQEVPAGMEVKDLEDMVTAARMLRHGLHNVRGGRWCQRSVNESSVLGYLELMRDSLMWTQGLTLDQLRRHLRGGGLHIDDTSVLRLDDVVQAAPTCEHCMESFQESAGRRPLCGSCYSAWRAGNRFGESCAHCGAQKSPNLGKPLCDDCWSGMCEDASESDSGGDDDDEGEWGVCEACLESFVRTEGERPVCKPCYAVWSRSRDSCPWCNCRLDNSSRYPLCQECRDDITAKVEDALRPPPQRKRARYGDSR